MNQRLTPTILRFDSLPSTNTEAARQAAGGAPEGLCIVAREQTAGRGRRERTWVSTKDAGLYFSIVLRPRFDASGWPLITLAAALAVHDALREACGLATDIKWPNDLMASGRKLCGILAETVETKAGRACVVGIGINLNDRAFPKEIAEAATSVEAIAEAATSVEAQTGFAPDAEVLLRALTRSLARYYESLDASDGAARIVREWETRSTYACGLRVSVALVAETFEGTTRGLEPDGALRVETDAHEIRIVRAGDIRALRSEPRRRQM